MAITTSKRNTTDPAIENTTAAVNWRQNPLTTLQTLFHSTCEFPWRPIIPTAVAAPLAERSSPIMIASSMIIRRSPRFFLDCRVDKEYAKDAPAYELAIAFDTKKYLHKHI